MYDLHAIGDIIVGAFVSASLWTFKRHIIAQSDAKKELLARIALLERQIRTLDRQIREKKN